MYRLLFLAILINVSFAAECPKGWSFSTTTSWCYYISNQTMTWSEAIPYCTSIGGDLVAVASYTESTYLKTLTSNYTLQPWIGIHRNATDGNFYDLKGTRVYSYWAINEPGINGDCASFRGSGSSGMQVTQCYNLQPAMCKQQPALCPSSIDYGGAYSRSGNITSPGYPVAYYNNLDCVYRISSPNGTYITLQFDPFYVEDYYDYVFVYDGQYANSTSKYLGEPYQYGRNSYESSSNVISFKFHTDSVVTMRGWLATWAAKPNTPPIKQTGNNGTLTSDNYPSDYASYTERLYYISVDYGFQINLTITDFVTEAGYDVLQVYSGSYVGTTNLVANLSGSAVAPWNYLSPSNYLTLKFTSDAIIQKKGWSLYWFMQ